MHQAVEEIIDKLIGAVKSDKAYYSLKDCLSAGFPSFIVERIRIEINEKLKSEYKLEPTKWSNVDQPMVKKAWQDFQVALFANSRIPRDEFYEVTSQVMDEIIKVLLQPRQHMADYIYKGAEKLGFEELVHRTDKLTVYKHFGKAIPLYMKKRKLNTLEKERCSLLIKNLDANLISSYTAEEWAQVLELLFILFGGKIDARLLQLFFEDKGMYRTAKTFHDLNEEISKQRFIEILQNPALLDVEDQEKFKEKYRAELYAQTDRSEETVADDVLEVDEKEQRLLDQFFDDYASQSLESAEIESFNALFKSEQLDKTIFEEFEDSAGEKDDSESTEKTDRSDDRKQFHENLVSVLDQAADSYKNLTDDDKEEDIDTESEPENAEEPEEKAEEEEDVMESLMGEDPEDSSLTEEQEEEEKPMWEQYLRPDQMEVLMGSEESGNEEMLLDDEELFDDLVDEKDEDTETIPELYDFMINQEGFFIEKIFNRSDKKYAEAVKRIGELENWKKASIYVQKNVFSPNEVDMTSEAAIDFIDRLQSYFDEYKS